MKKILVVSSYIPKPGFTYPKGFECPLLHQNYAHAQIRGMSRFFDVPIDWEILPANKYDYQGLSQHFFSDQYDGIVLSGSPYLLRESEPWILNLRMICAEFLQTPNKPIVGICFGAQLLNVASGGNVDSRGSILCGEKFIKMTQSTKKIKTRVYHENFLTQIPQNAKILATGPEGMPYIVEFDANVVGIQSHPELELKDETENRNANVFWKQFFAKLDF